ncbi:hypothetical protein OROGR_026550 [Orobanche gracilis]
MSLGPHLVKPSSSSPRPTAAAAAPNRRVRDSNRDSEDTIRFRRYRARFKSRKDSRCDLHRWTLFSHRFAIRIVRIGSAMDDTKLYLCFEATNTKKESVYLIFSAKVSDLTGNAQTSTPNFTFENSITRVSSMGCGLFDSKIVLAGGVCRKENNTEYNRGLVTYDIVTKKVSTEDIPSMRGRKLRPLVFELYGRLYVLDRQNRQNHPLSFSIPSNSSLIFRFRQNHPLCFEIPSNSSLIFRFRQNHPLCFEIPLHLRESSGQSLLHCACRDPSTIPNEDSLIVNAFLSKSIAGRTPFSWFVTGNTGHY